VVIPTTGDRGPLLRLSLASVLAQSVAELEVFVVGDGIGPAARTLVEQMARSDARVRLFDFPKDPRRGEIYRHQVLQEARGDIVCYLCDRDLMLPDHVAIMGELLRDHDFAHSLLFGVREDGGIDFGVKLDLADPGYRARVAGGQMAVIGLSFAAHTLAMYRRLPHGWRTTPEGMLTDYYMWRQFLNVPGCRAVSDETPTILYFKRGHHPGWPVARRLAELEAWNERLGDAAWCEEFVGQIRQAVATPQVRTARWLRAMFRLHPRLKGFLRAHPRLRDAYNGLATSLAERQASSVTGSPPPVRKA
jgi:hypothetical protein